MSIRVVRKQNYEQFPNNQTFSAIIFLRNTLILCTPRPQATLRGFFREKKEQRAKVKGERRKERLGSVRNLGRVGSSDAIQNAKFKIQNDLGSVGSLGSLGNLGRVGIILKLP